VPDVSADTAAGPAASPGRAARSSTADSSEFEDFFRENYKGLIQYALRLTRDIGEAEDAVDDAFLRAYERWGQIQELSEPRAWLYRVAANSAISSMRRARRPAPAALQVGPAGDPDPAEVAIGRDLVHRAENEISRMPRARARVAYLSWVSGLTTSEIAMELGITQATVRSQLRHARKRLVAALGDSGVQGGPPAEGGQGETARASGPGAVAGEDRPDGAGRSAKGEDGVLAAPGGRHRLSCEGPRHA
jgi:RNA polymerase sigma-70 factor (ECF subfamily)